MSFGSTKNLWSLECRSTQDKLNQRLWKPTWSGIDGSQSWINRNRKPCAGIWGDRLGSTLSPLNSDQYIALLQDVFDPGIHHFDTAILYGQGDSERYIGKTFKRRRNEVCLATKAGQRLTPLRVIVAQFKTPIRPFKRLRGSLRQVVGKQRAAGVNFCSDPAYIEYSLSRSIRRPQTNTVDIFYLHSPPLEALQHGKLMSLLGRPRQVLGSGTSPTAWDVTTSAISRISWASYAQSARE
jgi:hypothetical protein